MLAVQLVHKKRRPTLLDDHVELRDREHRVLATDFQTGNMPSHFLYGERELACCFMCRHLQKIFESANLRAFNASRGGAESLRPTCFGFAKQRRSAANQSIYIG